MVVNCLEKEILDLLKQINKKLDSHTEKLDSHTQKLDEHTLRLDEHTQILRALEHKTNVICAEQENLKHEVAEIKGEVKGIRKDMSSVELITAKNWSDITMLKAVK